MTLNIISLGAGVQSTGVFLMAAHGLITPKPDYAIFSDTQWEPKAVYNHLRWLQSGNIPGGIPIITVSAGNIRADALTRSNTTGQRIAAIPWHMINDKGKDALGRRQCTKEYKLEPIRRKIVELLGGKRTKGGCNLLIGISMDEVWRMKPSKVGYIVNRFPLIERRMTRRDILAWMEEQGYPVPPKSSCIGCPFHGDDQWRALTPDEFADAVEVDRAIRLQPGIRGTQFMHRKRIPLDQVDLRTPDEYGQPDLFGNECEGMCGV